MNKAYFFIMTACLIILYIMLSNIMDIKKDMNEIHKKTILMELYMRGVISENATRNSWKGK